MKTLGSQLGGLLEGGATRRQLAPFARYLAVLVGVVLLYGWLFHVIMAWEGQQHSWFTGVYWALTVMSTLGFGDITFTTDVGRVFSSIVLVTGVVLLLIILPFLFIRLVYAPWLDDRARAQLQALRRAPEGLEGHVILCTRDPVALSLVRRLEVAGIPALLVEPDPEVAGQLREEGVPVMAGEIEAVETLELAGVGRARLVLANASDTVNTNIVLTVRAVSPDVPVVALAESQDSLDILELSGATHVLPLKHQLGEHLAARVSAGSARTTVIGRFHDLLLAEFPVHRTPLQGRLIRDARLREATGMRIVGVWDQGRLRPADPDLVLSPMSVPVVIGTSEQVEALDELLVIYDANPHPVLILGGGKVGRAAARALKRRGIPTSVVEREGALEARIRGIPDRLVVGDAADREVLESAGIGQAPSVLITTHDDAMNIYLTVYCRRLNPDARILTRITHERNVDAVRRAGADFVLSYTSLGVQTVLAIVQQRDLIVMGEGVDLYHVPLPDALAGLSLAQADIGARSGLNVIALEEDGAIVTNPAPDRQLSAGSRLVALGTGEQRQRFDAAFA